MQGTTLKQRRLDLMMRNIGRSDRELERLGLEIELVPILEQTGDRKAYYAEKHAKLRREISVLQCQNKKDFKKYDDDNIRVKFEKVNI